MRGFLWILARAFVCRPEGPAPENLFINKLAELRDPLHAAQQVQVLRPDSTAKR